MRIAFVSNVVHPFVTGGAQKRIHEIGTKLAADGHEITVYDRSSGTVPTKSATRGSLSVQSHRQPTSTPTIGARSSRRSTSPPDSRAPSIDASPSTREGFGITYAKAMAADCTVIAAGHPESAASEVLGDAGILVRPERTALAAALGEALAGERPTTAPRAYAVAYNWGSVAAQAETVCKKTF